MKDPLLRKRDDSICQFDINVSHNHINIQGLKIIFVIFVIQRGCIKLIKVTVKIFLMLQKISILNKCFFNSIHQNTLTEKLKKTH